jgi:hypothetical protein
MSRRRKARRKASIKAKPVLAVEHPLEFTTINPLTREVMVHSPDGVPGTQCAVPTCRAQVAGCPEDDDCPAARFCVAHYLEDAALRGELETF